MKTVSSKLLNGLVFFIFLLNVTWANAWWENGKAPTLNEWTNEKAPFDDPRPFLKNAGSLKNMLPEDIYKKVTFDTDEMKNAWADLIGFRSIDVVGKIAPEIRPGVYTLSDKEKLSGLKELVIPSLWERFKKGGPPLIANFSEIKVVPTKQYYWALPIAEQSKKNEGTVKLDNEGYLIPDNYLGGYPFPKPSGKNKAQQIVYNWFLKYMNGENNSILQHYFGFNKNLEIDWDAFTHSWDLRFSGRVLLEPKGFYDERAKKQNEHHTFVTKYNTPRDSLGNVISTFFYLNPEKPNVTYFYYNQIRRLRKLSAEDTQDPFPGWDAILDDAYGFEQKLVPNHYPYHYKIVEEREYLFPSYTWDGSVYLDSTRGYELKNIEWERRPVYVIDLEQLDPNYIYKKRRFYFDKETFLLLFSENYDQKDRLYRTLYSIFGFYPEQGMFTWYNGNPMDHIDFHSTWDYFWQNPYAWWMKRDTVSVGSLMRYGK